MTSQFPGVNVSCETARANPKNEWRELTPHEIAQFQNGKGASGNPSLFDAVLETTMTTRRTLHDIIAALAKLDQELLGGQTSLLTGMGVEDVNEPSNMVPKMARLQGEAQETLAAAREIRDAVEALARVL